ncbi:MAG TPA: hypothetical protein VF857_02560, partial [Spirochaetota bacterium]
VSNNDDFIGVFYRDGNFKVTHRGDDLFDLHEHHDSPSSDKGAHERLAALSKQRRYGGSGFVLIEHNPLFYRANSFTSYLFPHTYFAPFHALGINPRAITSVIHPSENYLGISRYLKWRHTSGGKLSIFTDHDENPATLLNLFSGVKITLSPFTGMRNETSGGLTFTQIHNSFNLIGEMRLADQRSSIRFAFMKGSAEMKRILKEKLDFVLMSYSAYEDSSYAAKSIRAPIALFDDGNPSLRKFPSLETPIIRNNIQYEIALSDEQGILSRMNDYLPPEITTRIIEKDPEFLESFIPLSGKEELAHNDTALFFNALSLIRLLFQTTSDRKFSTIAKKLLREGYAHPARDRLYTFNEQYRIDLIISNGTIYEFARILSDPPAPGKFLLESAHDDLAIDPEALTDADERLLYQRITSDRKRLKLLLDLFLENPEYRKEVHALRKAIEERKKLFEREKRHPSGGYSESFIDDLRNSLDTDETGHVSRIRFARRVRRAIVRSARRMKSSPAIRRISAVLVILALVTGAIFLGLHARIYFLQQKSEKAHVAQIKAEKAERHRLTEEYHIAVSAYDIYLYANETAVKNGYASISLAEYNRQKNPHWIYPGNIFVMLDGSKVTVKEGDSLWNLAKNKIEKKYLAFFTIYDKAWKDYNAGKTIDPTVIARLRELAVNDKQRILATELSRQKTK